MDKSFSDLIKEAFLTNSPNDVSIHERSLLTELFESKKKADPFALYDFLPRKYRGRNLVLTRHLLYALRNIALFFIAIIYALYDLLHKIVTGKWKSKRLNSEVRKRRIPNKPWINWLHPEKWRGMQPSVGIDMLILVITVLGSLIILVWGLNFLVKEVVLSENRCRINECGVVTFDQSCLEEQHSFLLNAATFWTNTGIAVSHGDQVYITASGGMYSDIDEMTKAAGNNKEPLYLRSNVEQKYSKMDRDAKYCVYGRYHQDTTNKKNKPVFGSLLYQICNEVNGPIPYNTDDHPAAVIQINPANHKKGLFKNDKYHFEVDNSGILYFSFNDILLDDQVIDAIINNRDHSPTLYRDLTIMGEKNAPSSHDYEYFTSAQWLKTNVDSLIWFMDNLGETLINIRVEKDIWSSRLPFHKKVLVTFYRQLNSLCGGTEMGLPVAFLKRGLLLLLFAFLLWFGLDAYVSNKLKQQHHS